MARIAGVYSERKPRMVAEQVAYYRTASYQ